MPSLIDLTGKRFGALTVTELAPRDQWQYGRISWRCRCDCGKTCVVTGDNLRRGVRTSCGCRAGVAQKRRGSPENIAHKDYTGVTFGELTGIERVGRDKWLWQCSCGQRKVIRPSLVQAGDIQSCGHVLRQTGRKKILDDNVMGFVDGTSLAVIRGIVNGTMRSTNTSGVTGVQVVRRGDRVKYKARIVYQRKEHCLGTFDTLEEAAKARREAEVKYFGAALDKHKERHKNYLEKEVLTMKRENYYLTMDSFGAMCPANWEEIADYLNDIIDGYIDELTTTDALGFETLDEAELRERCDRLWEDYCGGRLPDAPVAGPIMGEGE